MTKSNTILFDSLKIDDRRVKCERDPETGLVSSVEGFLSAPGEGSPEDVARQFLDANYHLFAKRRSILDETKVERVLQSPAGYHVSLQQTRQDVPVQDATVSVHMTKNKRVHAARSSLRPEAADLDIEAMAEGGVDSEEAITVAVASVGAADDVAVLSDPDQVVFPAKEPRLAWKVSLRTKRRAQDWIVFVDAQTSKILERWEI